MSSVICQGLHSLDSQITDTNTTIRLKLSLPLQEISKNPSNPNLGIWNSLQSLSPSSRTPKQEGTYAHPILSEKSLELCTENLGSETGSDTDFSLSSPDFGGGNGEISTVGKPNSHLEKECRIVASQCADKLAWRAELPRKEMEGRKVNFPPPLTTLSGSGSVRIRAHREEGRLIVKAVGGPLENSTGTSFRAERSNGRLRLCFWEEDWDSDGMDFQENQESEIYVEGSGEEEEEEDEDEDEESEDMSGNDMDVEGEMGMEKFERPRWCKVSGECGNGSLWPSWVATS
ncbi:hypothetical protein RHGRI_003425 [Rhododendron griersonianum]|uniref:FAF domain-containing protein n=1 Tax=Rhododendron griersonianum TaxID=479676 RepID=A0AAV6L7A7_9ERIC|nr:hypothetical protein RHGRI_003425 [Rhododendron griersonianum]